MGNSIMHCESRFVGDDWQFSFFATNNGVAANLTGYTPGGVLNLPNNQTLAVTGSMVNTNNLATGNFTLTIPNATTSGYLPDATAYSLQVYLIDQNGLKSTYLVLPFAVLGL